MKWNLILCSLLFLLFLGVATSSGATKVEQLTFSGGLGYSSNGSQSVKLIMGEPFGGRIRNSVSLHQAWFGFWNILSTLEAAEGVESDLPSIKTKLFDNYPNPFNPSTRVSFSLDKERVVSIDVYDLGGRKVDSIFQGVKPQGMHTITYEPHNLASGSYVILMRADSFRATQRMMLIK